MIWDYCLTYITHGVCTQNATAWALGEASGDGGSSSRDFPVTIHGSVERSQTLRRNRESGRFVSHGGRSSTEVCLQALQGPPNSPLRYNIKAVKCWVNAGFESRIRVGLAAPGASPLREPEALSAVRHPLTGRVVEKSIY